MTVAGGLAAGSLLGSGGCGKKNGQQTIRVVSSLPRTGSAEGQTTTIVNGIKMAIEDVGGEVAGFTIEYRDRDDANVTAGQWVAELETKNAQESAADGDVMAYIGPYNSGAAKISMPILNEAGLLQVSPACTWPGLTKNVKKEDGGNPDEPDVYRPSKKITFCRVCTTDAVQGPLSAEFVKNNLKAEAVYVLDDSELYGKGVAGLFKRRAEEIGLKVLGHESINLQQQEFESLLTKIKGMNPGMVYFGGTSQTKGGQIAKDMKKVGLGCPLMVPDGCYEKAFIDAAGAANLTNCYATIVGADPSQMTGVGAEFVKKYQAKYGKMPEAFAAYGYEAGRVVLEAIRKVGKKDRKAILEACLATKDFDKGVVGKWSFDADGDTTLKQLTISKIEGGDFKPVTVVTG
jgi:branched-chain amino acid transport system substrate-binding protein